MRIPVGRRFAVADSRDPLGVWRGSHLDPRRKVTVPVLPRVFHVSDQSFEAEVLKAPTPTLVMFWAAWAGACLALAPVYEKASTQWENLGFAKMDIDEYPDVPTQLGITAIPTIVLYCGGQIVERLVQPPPSRLNYEQDRMRSSCPAPSYWPAAQ
jgi:thioredoxin